MSCQRAPPAEGSPGGTQSLPFDELMRQLAAEHARQQAVIEEVSAENMSLRARVGDRFTWGSWPQHIRDRLSARSPETGGHQSSGPQSAPLAPSDVELAVAPGQGVGGRSESSQSSSQSALGCPDRASERAGSEDERRSGTAPHEAAAAGDGPAGSGPAGRPRVCMSGGTETIPAPPPSDGCGSVTSAGEGGPSVQTAGPMETGGAGRLPEMWPEWGEASRRSNRRSWTPQLMCIPSMETGQTMVVSSHAGRCSELLAKLVIRPYSYLRMSWDFTSVAMVFYDMVTFPLMPFDPENSAFMSQMDWVTAAFWSLDIPVSFMTGLFIDGMIEMRPHMIARRYLRSWFAFDVGLVLADWMMLSLVYLAGNNAVGALRVGRAKRFTRIVRVIRLLHFVRLHRVVTELVDLINSEAIRAFFNVSVAISLILFINHYLACGWYWIGTLGASMAQPNWISENRIDEGTVAYSYATSLHWALTQFTPAGMEVHPHNLGERIYSILTLFFALVTFSSFLGTITAAMTQLRKHHTESGKQKHILRRYFNKNRISSDLSSSIWKHLHENHFRHTTRTPKEEVAVLRFLPTSLQQRLHHELYGPYVTRAPVLHFYMAVNPAGVIDVCYTAVAEKSALCGEPLFGAGQEAQSMFFIMSGRLLYAHSDEALARVIGRGKWAAEPVLWMRWAHRAPLVPETSCEYITVDGQLVRGIFLKCTDVLAFVRCYACKFARLMEDSEGDQWKTDLWLDMAKLSDLAGAAWRETGAPCEEEFSASCRVSRLSFSSADSTASAAAPAAGWVLRSMRSGRRASGRR